MMIWVSLFSLAMLAVFYLIFRVEGLKTEEKKFKRQISLLTSENKLFSRQLIAVAEYTQRDLKTRLSYCDLTQKSILLTIAKFLSENLSMICSDSAFRSVPIQDSMRKYLQGYNELSFGEVDKQLSNLNVECADAWAADTISGLLVCVEIMIKAIEHNHSRTEQAS